MVSLASRAATGFIRLRGSKRTHRSESATLEQVHALQLRPESYTPPKGLDRKVAISVRQVDGWPLYDVGPRDIPVRTRVLYLHGGSWYHQISPFHWRLIAGLAATTGTTFTVPIYPLVPLGTAAAVVRVATDLAAASIAEVGAANTSIMGDSAGGTIVLAVALQLRDRGLPAHRATVLISPALDLTFTDPRIAEIEPTDPWLAVPGPRAVARLWAGELALDDPIVSPLYGDLNGLAPVTMFSGTRDITNADARALVSKAEDADISVDYYEAEAMIHVYPLLPIPEGKQARAVIRSLLLG
jgi:acetyl esterase/lipase